MPLRNYAIIARIWGTLSAGLALCLIVTGLTAIFFGEWAMLRDFFYSAGVALGFALVCGLIGRAPIRHVGNRDAIFVVASGWVLAGVIGALPFVFAGELGLIDAMFESVSGFTTTGSSMMRELDAAPRSLAMWRSVTHWLGGMGIILLLIAVLPQLGVGGKLLLLRESTGPTPKGIEPKAQDTAMLLFLIYVGLTVVGIMAYLCTGIGLYESVNHCFSAISTGGFSTRYNSIASFDSLSVELVTIAVQLAGGINFIMYYKLVKREWRGPLYDTELRVFLGMFVVATLLITANLCGARLVMPGTDTSFAEYDFATALRHAAFQVSTMMTDCGFVLPNYDEWPLFSQLMLFLVTITGGCVGSTAGGFKILRLIILFYVIVNWLERAARPKLVTVVRVSGVAVEPDVANRVMFFLGLYVVWMTFGIFFMAFTGLPMDAAITSVIATMNNCGPGLGVVGPTTDFSQVPDAGKIFLTVNMLVGRLEMVTFLVMLLPSFWRRD